MESNLLSTDTAANQIMQAAVDAHGARIPPGLKHRVAALPDNYRLDDLERYMPARERFRGQLHTDSLADFVGYVKQRGTDARVPGFINAERLSATVLFNLGTQENPGHADDSAVLALKPSAPYAAACAVSGKQLSHKDALDWLEDWAENVTYHDATGLSLSAAAAMTALRKITIRATSEATSHQDNFRATRSALEDVEARGAQNLPAEVHFTCTPYAGLPARTLRLRLAVLTSTDKPVLVLRVRNLEAEKEGIAQDFKRALLTELEGVATLTIGTFTP